MPEAVLVEVRSDDEAPQAAGGGRASRKPRRARPPDPPTARGRPGGPRPREDGRGRRRRTAARRAGRARPSGGTRPAGRPAGIPRPPVTNGATSRTPAIEPDVPERGADAPRGGRARPAEPAREHGVVRRQGQLVRRVGEREDDQQHARDAAAVRGARAIQGATASVAATQASVNPTTQGLCRPEASETAPTQGARTSTAATRGSWPRMIVALSKSARKGCAHMARWRCTGISKPRQASRGAYCWSLS